MASSQIFGGTEECNSCESGWTMYIGSPIPGDDDDDGHSDAKDDSKCHDYDDGDGINYNHEDGSDDSMASDASSGPSTQGSSHFRLGGEKKASKPKDKQKAESRRTNEKEKKMVMAKRSTNASAQNGSKERRSNWIGKRK